MNLAFATQLTNNKIPKAIDKFYFQWHITNKCNLRCSHCYQEDYSDAQEMSLGELQAVANKLLLALSKWKIKGEIAITGGEPLIKKEYIPLLKYLNDANEVSDLDILSNGTLITEKIIDQLKTITKLRCFQISLDGASPKTHDAIRGSGTFERTLNNIRKLIQHNIPVYIMFTLQRYNMHDLSSLFDLAINEGISGLTIERCVPCGNGAHLKESFLSPQKIKEIFQYISDRADEEYVKGNSLIVRKFRTLWINLDPSRCKIGSETPIEKELGAICSIGLDALTILPDATVLPCRRLNIPIGNLKNDSLFNIWYTSDILWKIRNKSNLKGKC
jgi:MoaA/NifB/PqqE/SkfB family radical SAM enzyme